MLEEMTGRNFQSHQCSNLSFVEGLNVIRGTSTHGKSSIIRMIGWVIDNRPLGDDFVSWFAKKKETTSAELIFDDCSITKERRSGKNIYSDGKDVYEASRADVPEPVREAINMSDINIQTQHQPYFLINDTSGEVARKMNEFVGLDIIDTASKKAASLIRNTTEKISELEERKNSLDKELQEFAYIDDIATFIIELRLRVEYYEKAWQNQSSVGRLIESIKEIDTETRQLKKTIELEKPVKAILNKIYDRGISYKRFTELQSLINSLREVEEDLKDEGEWLKIRIPYSMMIKKEENLMELEKKKIRLGNMVEELKNINSRMAEEKDNLKSLAEDYKDLFRKNKVCPFCGTVLTPKTFDRIKI